MYYLWELAYVVINCILRQFQVPTGNLQANPSILSNSIEWIKRSLGARFFRQHPKASTLGIVMILLSPPGWYPKLNATNWNRLGTVDHIVKCVSRITVTRFSICKFRSIGAVFSLVSLKQTQVCFCCINPEIWNDPIVKCYEMSSSEHHALRFWIIYILSKLKVV